MRIAEALEETLDASRGLRGTRGSVDRPLDDEVREQLRELGYVE